MSSVAAASDSPPTVTVSLAGTSLPKRLQDMLAPVLSARRRKAFMSACKTGGSFALMQSRTSPSSNKNYQQHAGFGECPVICPFWRAQRLTPGPDNLPYDLQSAPAT